MTIVAGIEHNGTVWLGSDSCVSSGEDYSISTVAKCWRVGEPPIVMGTCGDVSVDNLLIPWKPPPYRRGDPVHWTRTRFIPALKKLLGELDDAEEAPEFDLLLGVGGKLLLIEQNYSLTHFSCGYGAIGSGANPALGSLYATARMHPKKRLLLALKASEACITNVRRPFLILDA